MPYSTNTKSRHSWILRHVRRGGWLGRIFNFFAYRRATAFLPRLTHYLPPSGRVLDVGCGTGHVAAVLIRSGRQADSVDLADLRTVDVPFLFADGANLPFRDASYDAVAFVTVLHHVDGAMHHLLLAEARRVARSRIVLVEDVFRTRFGAAMTKALDRVYNLDFGRHPHSNRRTDEWRALLMQVGCHDTEYDEKLVWFLGLPMRQAVIVGHVEGGGDVPGA